MDFEPLNYFFMTIILIAIFGMAAQNLSMLSGKWKNYYIALFFVKILLTSINAAYPFVVPLAGYDWANYTRDALRLLAYFPNSLFGIIQSNETLFTKEVAVGYYFFGVNPTYIYFLVCFGSLIAFKYMVLMVKEMTENDELAQKCGILYLVWPILLIYASTFLRENQCNLLFILSFYNFVLFVKKHKQWNFVCAIFWAVLGAMTHSSLIALMVCYSVFGSMCSKSGEIKFSPTKIVFGFLLLFALMASPFSSSMTEKFHGAENSQSVEEFTGTISAQTIENANTQYVKALPSNPIKLLLLEPYLFLMLVFSPLPFQIHTASHGIAFLIDAVPQFLLVRATFLYIFVQRKEGTSQIKGYKTMGLWLLLLFYFICSLGTTCFGTGMRHRAKVTPLLIAFAVMYYAEKKGVVLGTKEEEKEDEKEKKSNDNRKRQIQIPSYLRRKFFRSRSLVNNASRWFLNRKTRGLFAQKAPKRLPPSGKTLSLPYFKGLRNRNPRPLRLEKSPRFVPPFPRYAPFGFFPKKQTFNDSFFKRVPNSNQEVRSFTQIETKEEDSDSIKRE